jgi:hypothetical protein
VERPHGHVGLAGGSTPVARRRRRRRFKAPRDARVGFSEPPLRTEAAGCVGCVKEPPEHHRRPLSAAVGSGQQANTSYGTRKDAIYSSRGAQEYQEHDEEVEEARHGLVCRNLVSPAFGKMSLSVSISCISARFPLGDELVDDGGHTGVLSSAREGFVRRR